MGTGVLFWRLAFSLMVLLALSGMVTGSDLQSDFLKNHSLNTSDYLEKPVISNKTLVNLFENTRGFIDDSRSLSKMEPNVQPESGTGWQEITVPAVITHAGMYRVVNDYTTRSNEVGIIITSSDVYLDGNGHTFRGILGDECVGVGALSDLPLSNITVTNYSTSNCTAGITYVGIMGGAIRNTTHTGNFGGIAFGTSDHLTISGNQIRDYPDQDSIDELYGIAGIDSTNIFFERNHIANIFPPGSDPTCMGIMVQNTTNLAAYMNDITGPIPVGISVEPGTFDHGGYYNISDNLVQAPEITGIFVGGGFGRVTNNSVYSGENGVSLLMDDTYVLNNSIRENAKNGLVINGINLTLSENILENNGCNFYISGDSEEQYLHHIDETNLINGKPLVYIREKSGITIGPEKDPAMILAVQSQNISIHDINTGNNIAGIMLINATNVSLSGTHDTGSMSGVLASDVHGCTISDTTANGNSGYGFTFRDGSDIAFSRCTVSGSEADGFYLFNLDNIALQSCMSRDFTLSSREKEAYGAFIDYCRSVLIDSCTFSEAPNSGVFLSNSDDVQVIDSVMEKNQEQGVYAIQCNQVSFNHSVIAENDGSGIAMDFLSGFTVGHSNISGNKQAGLLFLDVSGGIIVDNMLNNTHNAAFVYESSPLTWNTTLTPGRNIVHGPSLGGNFWATPDGTGFSETHADRGDGICNASYILNEENTDYLPLAVPSEDILVQFSANTTSGTPPLTVLFTDSSTGDLVQWNWTFGDGTMSHEQNPVHTYTGIGRYTVTLAVTGQNGKQGVLRRPAYIDIQHGYVTGPNGYLRVNSSPENASVFLNHIRIGNTPLELPGIPAGTHLVTLTHEGYHDWSGNVTIRQSGYTLMPTVQMRKAE